MNSLTRRKMPLEAVSTSYSVVFRGSRYMVHKTADGDRYISRLAVLSPSPKPSAASISTIERDYALPVKNN